MADFLLLLQINYVIKYNIILKAVIHFDRFCFNTKTNKLNFFLSQPLSTNAIFNFQVTKKKEELKFIKNNILHFVMRIVKMTEKRSPKSAW